MEIFVVSDLEEALGDPPWETNSAAETEFSFKTDIQLAFSQKDKFVLPDLQIQWLYYHYYLQYFFKCQDVKFGGSRKFFLVFFFEERLRSFRKLAGKFKIFYYFNWRFSWKEIVFPKHFFLDTITILYRCMLKKRTRPLQLILIASKSLWVPL